MEEDKSLAKGQLISPKRAERSKEMGIKVMYGPGVQVIGRDGKRMIAPGAEKRPEGSVGGVSARKVLAEVGIRAGKVVAVGMKAGEKAKVEIHPEVKEAGESERASVLSPEAEGKGKAEKLTECEKNLTDLLEAAEEAKAKCDEAAKEAEGRCEVPELPFGGGGVEKEVPRRKKRRRHGRHGRGGSVGESAVE